MKRLYILRHAHAENGHVNITDIQRQLTQAGFDKLERISAELNKELSVMDAIFSSSAVRTQQTAEFMHKASARTDITFKTEPLFYDCDYQSLYRYLQAIDNQYTTVMVVGHNPVLSQLIGFLTNENIYLDPADCYVIEFEIDDWQALFCHSGRCVGYYR